MPLLSEQEVGNLYDMFQTRMVLHRRAYQHKTTVIFEHMWVSYWSRNLLVTVEVMFDRRLAVCMTCSTLAWHFIDGRTSTRPLLLLSICMFPVQVMLYLIKRSCVPCFYKSVLRPIIFKIIDHSYSSAPCNINQCSVQWLIIHVFNLSCFLCSWIALCTWPYCLFYVLTPLNGNLVQTASLAGVVWLAIIQYVLTSLSRDFL